MSCRKLWPIEMAPLSLEITLAPPNDAVIAAANDHPANKLSSTTYVINNLNFDLTSFGSHAFNAASEGTIDPQ